MQPARVRARHDERRIGVRSCAQPSRHGTLAWRIERRIGRGRRGRICGWASIGSDTGGSIRIPAAACGVVGLKPTFGEIPTHGVVPLSVSLDHVGPLARSVATRGCMAFSRARRDSLARTCADCRELRLGKLGGYFDELLDADVRRQFARRSTQLAGGWGVNA